MQLARRRAARSRRLHSSWVTALAVIVSSGASTASAGEALVAVATNFADTAAELADAFTASTGHGIRIATGATGKLHAQVVQGAPFDILLAADGERPARLEADGHVVAGQRFTYALGRVCLISFRDGAADNDPRLVLSAVDVRKIAIANPALAPYGAAALEVLRSLGVDDSVRDKIVMGENVGQAFALVATGNADLGFVAYAALVGRGIDSTRTWCAPADMHAPIAQDAVLLKRGADNSAARAFLEFLQSDDARAMIEAAGYALP